MGEVEHDVELRQLDIVDRLGRIEESVVSLRREMFGNGGMGICRAEKERANELFQRIAAIEATINRHWGLTIGVSAGISFLITLLAALAEWFKVH